MTREIIKTGVLIGGPRDGQRIEVRDGQTEIRMATADGSFESYLQEMIAGESVDFLVWRWQNLSVDDTIGRMIVGYSPPKREDAA